MMTKGRVLFVTHYFAPKNEIASVRLTHLASNLSGMGWEVDVLSVGANRWNPLERRSDFDFDLGPFSALSVIRPPSPRLVAGVYLLRSLIVRPDGNVLPKVGPKNAALARGPRMRQHVLHVISRLFRSVRDLAYVRAYTRATGLRSAYDVLFVSYGPTYMVPAAFGLAKRFPEASLVLDIRDPIVRRGVLSESNARARQEQMELAIARAADAITITEPEMLASPGNFGVPVVRVASGFDPNLHVKYPRGDRVGEGLSVYYGGRLYPSQEFHSLLGAVERLRREGREVIIHYAGNDGEKFTSIFRSAGLSAAVRDHGVIPRSESLRLAASADAVLVLTWNTDEKGIMPGKTFEALALDVPILGIVTGAAESSALARLLQNDPKRRVFSSDDRPEVVEEIAGFLRSLGDLDVSKEAEWFGPEKYAQYTYSGVAASVDRLLGQVSRQTRF